MIINTQDLRPCPLCGGTDLQIGSARYGHGCNEPSIECKCGLKFSLYYSDKLVETWNTRPQDAALKNILLNTQTLEGCTWAQVVFKIEVIRTLLEGL